MSETMSWIDQPERVAAAERSEQRGTPTTGATARARILVVEDEHLVALDILKVLARMGHVAVVAYSGEEAIRTAATTHLDLVLMDIKLKHDVDGIEAARIIRATRDVPVVYLTAYADDGTLARARVTEPYGYLVKPFDERELTAAIAMTLQRHEVEKLRRDEQQLRQFLGDATTLMAASLDYRAVARGAAELLVPHHADWCLVHLAPVAGAIADFVCSRPGDDDAPFATGAAGLIATVEATLRPQLLTEITDATLLAALGPRVHELGPRSLLCVPVIARGQPLGALAMVRGRTRAPYGGAELAFAEDFAHRVGMALDNALLYRKAERAIQMRDDVLAIVSHDLRSPLGAIILRAGSITADVEQRTAAESIVRSAKQMNRLIDDLLDASAINANDGTLALHIGVHATAELVRGAVEMFRLRAQAAAIALIEDVAGDADRVTCDRERIVQVLSNLVGNALKFTPEHGTITVSVERCGADLQFAVRDTGRGIPADQIPHLFERFWSADNRRGGVGLGLFIANGIVASHGGTLRVASTVGEGTSFSFALPAGPP